MATRSRLRTMTMGGTALLLALATIANPGEAQARPWRVHRAIGAAAGAMAGAMIGAAIEGHIVVGPPVVRVHHYPAWTPAPVYVPAPPPPAVVYQSAPPTVVVHQAPAPVVVQQQAVMVQQAEPARSVLGLSVVGLIDSGNTGESAAAGMAAALQFRLSPRSQLSLELQSLASQREWDRARREDIGVLLGARLFLWDAVLAPYLDVGGGFGRATFRCCSETVNVPQFLGRYGLGLELRLGRHLVLDAQLARVHRFQLTEDGRPSYESPVDEHERVTELRGGLTFLF
jgi:hypothetical protein